MKRGMIELMVLSALFLQGPIANTMKTNQFHPACIRPDRSFAAQTFTPSTVTGAP